MPEHRTPSRARLGGARPAGPRRAPAPVGIRPAGARSAVSRAAVGAAVLAAALGAAPAAQAAPPWSTATAIDAERAPRLDANFIDQGGVVPSISSGLAGPQVATWPGTGSDGRRQLAAIEDGRVVRVRSSSVVAASARYARTRTLHVDAKRVGDYRGFPTVRIGSRVGSEDLSSFGTARAVGGARTIRGDVKLAANESGAAVIAWKHVRRGQKPEIQYATRPAGGRFGAIRSVDADDVATTTEVAVGVEPGGRAVVAYGRDTVARSATRLAVTAVDTRTGRAQEETRVAPPAGLDGPTEVTVGVAQRNRGLPTVVAWGEITPSATGDRAQDRTVPTVAQADASGRFGPPQALDAGGAIGSLVAVDEGVAVGWVAEGPGYEGHGESGAVRVARRGPDGAFGAPEDVDDRTVASGSLRVGSDGLQPPGLGARLDGGLTAVYADVGANAQGGEMRLSSRPAG